MFEDDVDSLLALRFFAPDEEGSVATEHPLCLGLTKEIDWLKRQQRLTFERVGYVDPLDVEDYRSKGGFIGLNKALNMPQQMILDEVKASGLRGRGGAAFPTGIKWQTVADQLLGKNT